MMQYWDISVQNKNDQLILIVEVKANRKLHLNSFQWASKSYYNFYHHQIIPPSPYFLFAFLDYFYLWDNKHLNIDENNQIIIPNYRADAKVILNPYFERINVKSETINEYGLEIIVSSWLTDIMTENININKTEEYQDILINSGLYDSILGGYLKGETHYDYSVC